MRTHIMRTGGIDDKAYVEDRKCSVYTLPDTRDTPTGNKGWLEWHI